MTPYRNVNDGPMGAQRSTNTTPTSSQPLHIVGPTIHTPMVQQSAKVIFRMGIVPGICRSRISAVGWERQPSRQPGIAEARTRNSPAHSFRRHTAAVTSFLPVTSSGKSPGNSIPYTTRFLHFLNSEGCHLVIIGGGKSRFAVSIHSKKVKGKGPGARHCDSWLAWANDTTAHYAAIHYPRWTRGAARRHSTAQSATLDLYPVARKLLLISCPAEGRRLSWSEHTVG